MKPPWCAARRSAWPASSAATRRSSAGTAGRRGCPRRFSPGRMAGLQGRSQVGGRDARDAACDQEPAERKGRCGGDPPRSRTPPAGGQNLMPASIECARRRVTTGEWAEALREVFGEYRPGHRRRGTEPASRRRPYRCRPGRAPVPGAPRMVAVPRMVRSQARPRRPLERLGDDRRRRPRCGLRGHYGGIRWSVPEIVSSAVEEDATVLGLSVLSGAHVEIVQQVRAELERQGRGAHPCRPRRHRARERHPYAPRPRREGGVHAEGTPRAGTPKPSPSTTTSGKWSPTESEPALIRTRCGWGRDPADHEPLGRPRCFAAYGDDVEAQRRAAVATELLTVPPDGIGLVDHESIGDAWRRSTGTSRSSRCCSNS